MSYENATYEECLEQIKFIGFKDEHGHDIENSAAFIRLCQLATQNIFELRTFPTDAQYMSYTQTYISGNGPKLPELIGYFTGHPMDIQDYHRDKEIGYFTCNALRPTAISHEMAAEKNAIRKRIKELEAELKELKSK